MCIFWGVGKISKFFNFFFNKFMVLLNTSMYAHLFPLQDELTQMPVGWKLFEEKALKGLEMSLFITCIIEKLIITHQEPIEGIKVWLLLRHPCNILGYPSKYCNYTSKKKLGWFPHSLHWITILIFISQKNIIEHKSCRIRF